MPVYIMPTAVSTRLKESLQEAERLLGAELFDAKRFHFDVVYTPEELSAFDIPQSTSLLIVVEDASGFEALIPEQRNGVLNFLRLNNATALEKVENRLAALRQSQRPD